MGHAIRVRGGVWGIKLTRTEEDARRLRDKCTAGPDRCGDLLSGFLGSDTPPLTDRQKDRILASAALHFATSKDCNRCPQALATACETAPDLLAMVARLEDSIGAKNGSGLVSALAKGVQATRANPKGDPAPNPRCAACGVEMHPFAATATPLHLENGQILCFVCIGSHVGPLRPRRDRD